MNKSQRNGFVPQKVHQNKLNAFKMRSVLKKVDAFGEPFPMFNLKGETHVNT